MGNNSKGTKKRMGRKKKYTFYTLGLGLVLLGASQLTPAQKAVERTDHHHQEKLVEGSPATHRAQTTQHTTHRKQAINSLSKKNKAVFHTLDESDQKKVVNSHKSGKGAQHGLTKVLNEDADHHEDHHGSEPSKHSNSPASKSMRRSKQNIYD